MHVSLRFFSYSPFFSYNIYIFYSFNRVACKRYIKAKWQKGPRERLRSIICVETYHFSFLIFTMRMKRMKVEETRIFRFYLPFIYFKAENQRKHTSSLYIYFSNAFCPAPSAALYTVCQVLLSPNGLSVCFLHLAVSLMTYVFTCAYICIYKYTL